MTKDYCGYCRYNVFLSTRENIVFQLSLTLKQ